jgi:hypothetical protein
MATDSDMLFIILGIAVFALIVFCVWRLYKIRRRRGDE